MTKPLQTQQTVIEPELDVEAIYAKRIAGVAVKRIAKQFGVAEAVINAILLERTQQVLSDDNIRIMVGLESDRLDQTLEALWPAVQKGDPVACGLAIKISQRRAVLFGIDAPSSHSVEIYRRYEEAPLTSTQSLALKVAQARGESITADDIRAQWAKDHPPAAADSKARAAIESLRAERTPCNTQN